MHESSGQSSICMRGGDVAAGCAPGWNAAMRYMAYHDDIPWAVVVNSDIYAPPGTPTLVPKSPCARQMGL